MHRHRCNKKQFYMLTIENEDYKELELCEEMVNDVQPSAYQNDELAQLSLHALIRIYSVQTMRMK